MKMDIEEEKLSLEEILVRSTYQTQISHFEDKKCENAIGFGSGFMVNYKDTTFFITADHVLHPDDYDHNPKVRTGREYSVVVFNNISNPDNYFSTLVTPLGGFYFADQFNILKYDLDIKLVDATACILKPHHLEKEFLTDEVKFGNSVVPAGKQKIIFFEDNLTEPNEESTYYVYGKVRHELKNNMILNRRDAFWGSLRYIDRTGEYLLLNTPDIIQDSKDWEGLSGSPVLDSNGLCVGVLCSITPNSKAVYVLPVEKIKLLMELALLHENSIK